MGSCLAFSLVLHHYSAVPSSSLYTLRSNVQPTGIVLIPKQEGENLEHHDQRKVVHAQQRRWEHRRLYRTGPHPDDQGYLFPWPYECEADHGIFRRCSLRREVDAHAHPYGCADLNWRCDLGNQDQHSGWRCSCGHRYAPQRRGGIPCLGHLQGHREEVAGLFLDLDALHRVSSSWYQTREPEEEFFRTMGLEVVVLPRMYCEGRTLKLCETSSFGFGSRFGDNRWLHTRGCRSNCSF